MSTTPYPHVELHISGVWRQGAGGDKIAVLNPATGGEIGTVAVATKADLEEAAQAAQKGFEIWRKMSAAERATIMRKAAGLLRERKEATAQLLTSEQGKPIAEARMEVMSAADIIEYFAEEGKRISGRIVAPRAASGTMHIYKEPVGVVAAFTPWNFPINQVVRKLSAALATGCSIIVKAPEETPAAPAELIRAFVDAGIPTGVVNLVYGNPVEISEYLIAHPIVRKITFTGSTPVGKQLAAMAGAHMKRATMELGGHAPVIVAEDADIARAAKVIALTKFRNAGQVCVSPTRFLVANKIRTAFTEEFVAVAKAQKVGNGLEDKITMGPLANDRRLGAMERLTTDAVKRGARLATGGERIGNAGNFYTPTVLLDVPQDSLVFNEEPFGPIAAMQGFDDLDAAITEANRLPYGLAAYAFTTSLRNAHRLSEGLQTGMLWLNQPTTPWPEMPFGGVKDSGYGSEGGMEALEAYLNPKSVYTQIM